jgi:hypothetical protein
MDNIVYIISFQYDIDCTGMYVFFDRLPKELFNMLVDNISTGNYIFICFSEDYQTYIKEKKALMVYKKLK